MVGERRRAIALASLVALGMYLIVVALAKWLPQSGAGNIITLDWWRQSALVAPIWLGSWLIALAHREVIARGEGAYGAFLAFTHLRGMRFLGLILGVAMLTILAITFFAGNLSARDGVIGGLSTLVLLALGLPDAPTQNYLAPLPEQVQISNPSRGRALVPINTPNTRQ